MSNPAKELREASGLTQQQCASLVNVASSTWFRWEAESKMPRKRALEFQEALSTPAPTPSPVQPQTPRVVTMADPIDRAAYLLRESGRLSNRPLYPDNDVFGAKRIEHLRFVPPDSEETPEEFEPTNVSPEEVREMLKTVRHTPQT